MNAKLEITRVDNGYIVAGQSSIGAMPESKIFSSWAEVSNFLKEFFQETLPNETKN